MPMADEEILVPHSKRSRPDLGQRAGRATPRNASGPIIDQEGREIPMETIDAPFAALHGLRFDFGGSPFAHLTREQRLARLEGIARLLDVAFILPGTNVRFGIDGVIGLIPVVGDIIATALSLWLVREARTLGAPWHVVARMLGNVAFQGAVGVVPLAGDAIDVLFRANMRNARILRRWLEKQPR